MVGCQPSALSFQQLPLIAESRSLIAFIHSVYLHRHFDPRIKRKNDNKKDHIFIPAFFKRIICEKKLLQMNVFTSQIPDIPYFCAL
jgi:hypothetical protein